VAQVTLIGNRQEESCHECAKSVMVREEISVGLWCHLYRGGFTGIATGKPARLRVGRNGGGERVRGWWQAPWCRGSLKTDDTLDVRNAAAAFPAAKPLRRRTASSEQHEPASGVGFPIPTRPGARAGRPSKRGDLVREAGDVVAERRRLQRTHARPGLPSLCLSEPPGFIPGEV